MSIQNIKKIKFDKTLFISIIILLILGTITFLSASLGKLSTDGSEFYPFVKNQLIILFFGGTIAFLLGLFLNYKIYKRFAIPLFILSLLFALTVFIPQLNFEHQGGVRWINLFGFSIQPSEFLKFTSVVFMAYLGFKKNFNLNSKNKELFIFIGFSAILGLILLVQKDFGTLFTILVPAFIVFMLSGSKLKHNVLIIGIGIIGFIALLFIRPYMQGRILTFLNPDRDLLGSSYQINQSLIAIGSGELTGRGLGQSIQKFSHYLPEQATDSIFAVYAEEMGFIGSLILLILLFFIIYRASFIAKNTPDTFGKLLILGIIAVFTIQTCLNLLSAMHWAPVSGVPLPLFSKGGTSLIITLFMFGVILNISKNRIRV